MENILGIVLLSVLAGLLTIYTITSNLMVIIAFKINKKLHTLSNYCLVSLAVSDLTVGIFLMPMYTIYLFIGYWPLGPLACNIWLSLDYGLCAASVINLFVIALDRLLSVTKPLTYRRTPIKMGAMIASAWIISLLICPPWIFIWPFIDGERIVPVNECYVQFLVTNPMMTTLLSSLSFYTPVILTTTLYCILYVKTERRRLRKKALSSTTVIRSDALETTTNVHEEHTSLEINRSTPCSQSVCCCLGNRSSKMEDSSCTRPSNDDVSSDHGNKQYLKENDSNSSKETHDTLDMNDDMIVSYISGAKTPGELPQEQIDKACLSKNKTHGNKAMKALAEQTSFQEFSGDFTSTFNTLDAVAVKAVMRKRKRSDSKMAKILSATLLSLIITNGPYYTTAIIESFCPGSIHIILASIVYWICYLNSSINPLLYATCNANFRRTFLQLLRCKGKC